MLKKIGKYCFGLSIWPVMLFGAGYHDSNDGISFISAVISLTVTTGIAFIFFLPQFNGKWWLLGICYFIIGGLADLFAGSLFSYHFIDTE